MNTFEIIILAMALVFNSWMAYLNAGIVLAGKPMLRLVNYAGIMCLTQFLMAGVGIWVGYKIGSFEVRVNMLISLSILLIFGLKVLFTGIRMQTLDKAFDYTDNKVIVFAALAEGITPLIIGTAIGLLSVHLYLHWFVVGGFLLAGILSALILTSRMGSDSLKLRLGPVGGLLLLAAALKLMLSLTTYYI